MSLFTQLTFSLLIVRHEARVTQEVVVVEAEIEVVVDSEVEAEEEVVAIEVVEVVVGEAEEDEADTALAQGARSGSPLVPTLSLWDSQRQYRSACLVNFQLLCCMYTSNAGHMATIIRQYSYDRILSRPTLLRTDDII
jgi:hypothetical protein